MIIHLHCVISMINVKGLSTTIKNYCLSHFCFLCFYDIKQKCEIHRPYSILIWPTRVLSTVQKFFPLHSVGRLCTRCLTATKQMFVKP